MMAPRITLIKSYRNKETLRLLELREVAELISQGEYDDQVSTFRRDLPTMRYAHVSNNGTLEGYENWPRTCRGSVSRWNRRTGTTS
jgi:hypothetical protein